MASIKLLPSKINFIRQGTMKVSVGRNLFSAA